MASKHKIGNAMFTKQDTIGDGNCLLHSILYALDENYPAMSNSNKMKRADEFRAELAAILNSPLNNEDAPVIGDTILGPLIGASMAKNPDGTFEEESFDYIGNPSNYTSIYTLDHNLALLRNGREWLTDLIANYISNYFGINIVLYHDSGRHINGQSFNFFQFADRPTIFIHYRGNVHFSHMTLGDKRIFQDSDLMNIFQGSAEENQFMEYTRERFPYYSVDVFLTNAISGRDYMRSLAAFGTDDRFERLFAATSDTIKRRYALTLNRIRHLTSYAKLIIDFTNKAFKQR